MGSSYGSIRLWWEVVENRIEVKRLPQAVTLMHKSSSSSSSSLIDQIVCHPHRGRHCQTHHHPLPKWCYLYTSTQGFPLVKAYFLTFFKECFCDTTTLQNDPQMRCSFVWICTTRCIIVEKRHLHCFPSLCRLLTYEPEWSHCGIGIVGCGQHLNTGTLLNW